MSNRQTFASALDEITTSPRDTLGSIRWEGSKCYKYVKIRNTTATVVGAAGDTVCYEAEDGHRDHTVVIDRSDGDNPPLGAGQLQAAVAGVHSPQASYYGWIQIKGYAVHSTTLGGSAGDGHPLTPGTTDKELTKAAESDSTAVYKQVCAYANDASAKIVVCDFPF